jgi:hypothetical protein
MVMVIGGDWVGDGWVGWVGWDATGSLLFSWFLLNFVCHLSKNIFIFAYY